MRYSGITKTEETMPLTSDYRKVNTEGWSQDREKQISEFCFPMLGIRMGEISDETIDEIYFPITIKKGTIHKPQAQELKGPSHRHRHRGSRGGTRPQALLWFATLCHIDKIFLIASQPVAHGSRTRPRALSSRIWDPA